MRWVENPRRVVYRSDWRLILRLREYYLVDLDPNELDDALFQERLERRDDNRTSRIFVMSFFAWIAVNVIFALLFPSIGGSVLDLIVILLLFTGIPALLACFFFYAFTRNAQSAIYIHPRDGQLVCYAPDRFAWCPLKVLDPAISVGMFKFIGGRRLGTGTNLFSLNVGETGHGVWLLLHAGKVRRWVLLDRFNLEDRAHDAFKSWKQQLGARELNQDEKLSVPTKVHYSKTGFRRHDKREA